MNQTDFEKKHQATWSAMEAMLEAGRKESNLKYFPETYQAISHHLALAKHRRYSTSLVQRLNHLVVEGHKRFYGDAPRLQSNFFRFIAFGFPQVVRRNHRFVNIAMGAFFLPGFLFLALCWTQSDLIYSLMGYDQVAEFESMYDPSNGELGRERQSDTDLMMFSFYIYNNIGISFQTFASGVFFGIGSLFYLIYNGIFIGAAAGHMARIGYESTFFPFVVGHGAFELTAIGLAGAAGLKLGWALIAPGNYSRMASLRVAAEDAVRIIYGSTLMLLIAAFIEAFWSSSSTVPVNIKYAVGFSFWILVIWYLIFVGRSRRAA